MANGPTRRPRQGAKANSTAGSETAPKSPSPLARAKPKPYPWKDLPAPLAGVDEAGRGCLAGPVVAAAVILPESFRIQGLADSKKLTPEQRQEMEPAIKAQALAWSVGVMWPPVIDSVNILQATFRAMHWALSSLKLPPACILIDGSMTLPGCLGKLPPQHAVVKGDSRVPAISAASVIAKTFRDRIMLKLDKRYPGYHFAANKGYGSRAHMAALQQLGPCRIHRKTFKGVLPEPVTEKELWLPGI